MVFCSFILVDSAPFIANEIKDLLEGLWHLESRVDSGPKRSFSRPLFKWKREKLLPAISP